MCSQLFTIVIDSVISDTPTPKIATLYLIVSQLRAMLDISERANPCPTKELLVTAVIQAHTQLQFCNICTFMLKMKTVNINIHT